MSSDSAPLLVKRSSLLEEGPHVLAPPQILHELGTSLDQGLLPEQSKARRRVEGRNVIPPPHRLPAWLCCFNSCLNRSEKMVLYHEIVTDDAEVRRADRWVHTDAASLVRGDIVKLKSKQRAPADVRIIHSTDDFQYDASEILTSAGRATHGCTDATAPSSDLSANVVPCGSLVLQGEGVGVVVATGARTLLGRLILSSAWPIHDMNTEEL